MKTYSKRPINYTYNIPDNQNIKHNNNFNQSKRINCNLQKKKNPKKNNVNVQTNNFLNTNNIQYLQPLSSQMKYNKIVPNKSDSVYSKNQFQNRLGVIQKKKRFNDGVIGLFNTGNTCYLNSALQNLKNVYPLTLYLLKNYETYNSLGFTYKYCELIANLINQETGQCFQPKDFFKKLSDMAPIFRFGEQNDSNFCIIYILNFLEKETKIKLNNSIKTKDNALSEEENKKFEIFLNKLYTKRNSYIIDLFYGFQEDKYKCINCNYANLTFQGFSVLNLSIMKLNNPIQTLEDAIKYYQNGNIHEKEPGFNCPICKKTKILTQSVIIYFPKILIINFKRIGENNFYNHNVEVSTNLKLNNYEYELTGFIIHIGGANAGHNIAICKNFFDDFWYVYDDDRVKRLENSIYIKKNRNFNNLIMGNSNYINNKVEPDTTKGFLFFYKKKGDIDNIIKDEEKKLIREKSSELRKFYSCDEF